MSFIDFNSGVYPKFTAPQGDKIKLNVTDVRHYGTQKPAENVDNVSESFADVLKKSLEKVNDLQTNADDLTQKIAFNPNSVDAHDVMIAAEKARISLTFTKTLIDGAIRAYRELSNLR